MCLLACLIIYVIEGYLPIEKVKTMLSIHATDVSWTDDDSAEVLLHFLDLLVVGDRRLECGKGEHIGSLTRWSAQMFVREIGDLMMTTEPDIDDSPLGKHGEDSFSVLIRRSSRSDSCSQRREGQGCVMQLMEERET